MVITENGVIDPGYVWPGIETNDFLQFAVLTGCLRIAKEVYLLV